MTSDLITLEVYLEKETIGTETQISLFLEPETADDYCVLTAYLESSNINEQTLSYSVTLSTDELQPTDNPFGYIRSFLNQYLESQIVEDLFSTYTKDRTIIRLETSKYVDILSKWYANNLTL